MAVDAREVKRCAVIAALLINRTTASVKQQCGERQMPVATRLVKRCQAITILAVDRHPRIKVQRAQRHVTFSRRSAQPSLADLTTSLTQRFDAEATGVRHHVQTRSVLQRNDALVVKSTSADRHVEPLDAQLRQCDDDGFLQCLTGAACFPNLHVHLLLPCQTRRDVHVCCGVWLHCLLRQKTYRGVEGS